MRLAIKTESVGLIFIFALFFIWPIPHTISLRYLLLFACLSIFSFLNIKYKNQIGFLYDIRLPLLFYGLLTIWIYIVAFFISKETAWSLNEINGQWTNGLLAFFLGILVALFFRDSDSFKRVLTVLYLSLMIHILYISYEAIIYLIDNGQIGRMQGLTEGPDKSNYLTNILLSFLFVEIFYRTTYRKKIIEFSTPIIVISTLIALFTVYAEGTRNGITILLLLLISLIIIYLYKYKARLNKKIITSISLVLLGFAVFGIYIGSGFKHGSSWGKLIATIPIAIDTKANKAWLDEKKYGLPKLPDGTTVDESAYMRIAWFKKGIDVLTEHPFGIGYGRNAFGHGIKAKYNKQIGHSHSGMLDLAIGIGIPGAVLWFGFLLSLVYLAFRRFNTSGSYYAILLFMVILDFGSRMMIDSVIRDHMLQQFLFLVGLLVAMLAINQSTTKDHART